MLAQLDCAITVPALTQRILTPRMRVRPRSAIGKGNPNSATEQSGGKDRDGGGGEDENRRTDWNLRFDRRRAAAERTMGQLVAQHRDAAGVVRVGF